MNQPLLQINVPFVYEATLIPPRCRKAVHRLVRDTVKVSVRALGQAAAPVAIISKSEGNKSVDEYRWDGNRLYRPVMANQNSVTWEQLVAKAGADALRHGDPLHTDINMATASKHQYATLNDLNGRTEWDNRERKIEQIREMAASLLVVEGVVFIETLEPSYVVMTFGCGALYSVCVTSGCYAGTAAPEPFQFNALQRAEAIAYAQDKVGTATKQSPTVTPLYTYEVLLPEVIKMPANPWVAS